MRLATILLLCPWLGSCYADFDHHATAFDPERGCWETRWAPSPCQFSAIEDIGHFEAPDGVCWKADHFCVPLTWSTPGERCREIPWDAPLCE